MRSDSFTHKWPFKPPAGKNCKNATHAHIFLPHNERCNVCVHNRVCFSCFKLFHISTDNFSWLPKMTLKINGNITHVMIII